MGGAQYEPTTVLCTENFAKHEVRDHFAKWFAKWTFAKCSRSFTQIYTNLQEVCMKVHEDFAKFSVHSTVPTGTLTHVHTYVPEVVVQVVESPQRHGQHSL